MKSKLPRLKRTPENTANVARLASEGKGADEIAKLYGVNPHTVKIFAWEAGIKLPTSRNAKHARWTEEAEEELARKWNARESVNTIASFFGVSASAIRNRVDILRSRGHDLIYCPTRQWTPERVAALKRDWQEGVPTHTIAKKFGVSQKSVYTAIYRFKEQQ